MTNLLTNELLALKARNIKIFFTDVDGTLTNGCTLYSNRGESFKGFNHRDGTAVLLLKLLNIETGIITGENSEIVKRRAEKLNIEHCFLGIKNKTECLSLFVKDLNWSLDNICYIGDDLNDVKLMKAVGLSFAPKDSSAIVKKISTVTCKTRGGEGAFREAAEILLGLRGYSAKDFLELL
jgi:3-deoxy-D-glycero-D-galacto-nononate 9-phosphatase